MLRQWERGFDDHQLNEIIKYVYKSFTKRITIVTPCFLGRKNIFCHENQCAVIIHQKNLLVSIFWCKDPNYLFSRYKSSSFQLLV